MLTITFAIITAISILGLLCIHPFRKHAVAPKAIVILLSIVFVGVGATALSYTYDLYTQGLAMGIGRSAKNFSIVSNPSVAKGSIIFHSALGIILVAVGLYLPTWLFKVRKEP